MLENIHYIPYCGLDCRNCLIFTAEIADLAKELKKQLIQYDFSRVAQGLSTILEKFREFKNYKQCYEVLEAMDRLRCERVCREGGGSAVCRIRICCQNMNINGCWECQEFESCDMLEYLKPVNEDAPVKNLRILKNKGVEGFLKGTKYW